MFWQAAVSGGVNTDGLNIYLDGALAIPPPLGEPGWAGGCNERQCLAGTVMLEARPRCDASGSACMCVCMCACVHVCVWGEGGLMLSLPKLQVHAMAPPLPHS